MQDRSGDNLEQRFTVGGWLVEPDALRMVRGDVEKKLEPKVMQVLVHLAHHGGQVVSRQQLESTVWRGVIVGYDSLGSTIIKLRKAFNDDSRNPAIIQTIPKKGYRLIAPVAFVDSPTANTAGHALRPGEKHPVKTRLRVVVSLALVIAAVVIAALLMTESRLGEPSRTHSPDAPRLAVLPFRNLSADPRQEYFSDGISADLITDLAKLDQVAVIARNSTFVYRNTDVDVRRLKAELGVDYVVEGSVRRDDTRVRISARLIDASSGINIWADRFDAEFSDMFSLQDMVVERIVSALELRLSEEEQDRIAAVYTSSISAYDYFLQGWQYFWRYTPEDNAQAREHYLKAVELDPDFARAYANLAVTHAFDYMNGWSDDPEDALEQANTYITEAVRLDERLPQVQWAVGIVNTYAQNYDVAIRAAEKAIAQSPNFADGYGLLATVLNYAGKPAEARKVMQKAMRLNPRHPFIYQMILGQIHFNLREYQTAADHFKQAAERNPTAQEVRLWLAATYAYLGRRADAGWELEQIDNAGAKLSVDYFEQFFPLKDPALRKHLIDGLIEAGLDTQRGRPAR